jgi:hypothetical protein
VGGVVGLVVCGGAVGRGCAGACCPAAATNTPEATTQLMSSGIFMPLITAENVPRDDAGPPASLRTIRRASRKLDRLES